MEVQTCPEFIKAPQTQALAARSKSASLRTIIGSLPPSSKVTGINLSTARCITFLPVSTLPVKEIISAWSISASPVLSKPVTTWIRFGGNPAFSASSTPNKAESGVRSDGFMTTALPAIIAGIASPIVRTKGKFHGLMIPTTPRGWYRE